VLESLARVLPIIRVPSYQHRLVKLLMLHVVANSNTEKQDSCFQGRGQELSCPAALMNQFMSLIVNDLKARSERKGNITRWHYINITCHLK